MVERNDCLRLTKLPEVFQTARPVLQRIERAGFQAYFVGGSVRDTLLGDHIHDVDMASSAYPAEIKKLFPKTIDTGIQHGTVTVLFQGHHYEITTFRTESGYQDYRRPKKVTFIRSLPEDLKRRDFTINALAMRENGDITDLFDGIGDLKRHLIKAVGNPERRFHEDALRMMRAVRFASKLNFKIDPPTLKAIDKYSYLLTKIAVERIHTEFVKMMLGQNPHAGLAEMLRTDMYQYVPEFKNYLKVLQKIDAFPHLRLRNENQVWALICYLAELNRSQINHFLRAWKSSDEIISDVQATVKVLNAMQQHRVDSHVLYAANLFVLKDATWLSNILSFSYDWSQVKEAYLDLPIKKLTDLQINGGIIIKRGICKPSPKLGEILHTLRDLVLDKKLLNQKQALITKAKELAAQ